METETTTTPNCAAVPQSRSLLRRVGRGCLWGCSGTVVLFLVLVVLLVLVIKKTPKSYTLVPDPIPPPALTNQLGGGLDGFTSPYVGHTGSWDGKGGALGGGPKMRELDEERAMGLRWTFMCVYWRALEPDGPVDLSGVIPPAWQELDAFVIAAHARGLNILMQAPVVGGNAGGPPKWAGRREPGKSAPANMEALAAFAGKLAERYHPDGVLARREGWGARYGVRAWELDNEPESYLTHWKGQAGDYAEFVTLAAGRIKAVDPQAVVVVPGMAAGKDGLEWLAETLHPARLAGSPVFRARGQGYSIGPVADAVSLHNYEGLDSAFASGARTIGDVFTDVRSVFEAYEQRAPGFTYARKLDYWHTEGNYDFLGLMSASRRAAWRFQFFTRAFAAGVRKVVVMDASAAEQMAVRAYVATLPDPFPMLPATKEVTVRNGQIMAFRHLDGTAPDAGQVWVLWAVSGGEAATIDVPVHRGRVSLITVTGETRFLEAKEGKVTVNLSGDAKMAPPVLVVDRPGAEGRK